MKSDRHFEIEANLDNKIFKTIERIKCPRDNEPRRWVIWGIRVLREFWTDKWK